MKKLSIIGSTGSIGTQTLDIVRANNDIKITGLAAGNRVSQLERQIREFKPDIAAVWDEQAAKDLRVRIADLSCKVGYGIQGLIEVASYKREDKDKEMLLSAVVGMIGIEPAVAAIKSGKEIALANKESLVCAGHIILPLARKNKVNILPVDSEHSAIFQCLRGNEENKVSKILLTASGGPFRGYSKERLKKVRLEEALKHPNWSMGKKISIDSATMVNKGLEVMEACHLFNVNPDKVEVLVQPSSVVHSMVEFEDGAVLAQLGTPDMKLPIQYALYYPYRRYLEGKRLDFSKLADMSFEAPDTEVFEGLALAYKAAHEGGSLPTVFNAANEYAVSQFLERKIGFSDIIDLIKNAMQVHKKLENPSVSEIINIRAEVEQYLRSLK